MTSRIRVWLATLLLFCSGCGRGHVASKTPREPPPETWITASPFDSGLFAESPAPLPPPRIEDVAEISLQGDSMTIEVADGDGRSISWNSWRGLLPGASLEHCKVAEGTLVSQADNYELVPYVELRIISPSPGPHRIRVRAQDDMNAYLSVVRRAPVRVDYGAFIEGLAMRAGETAEWVAEWSASGVDSCWVRARQVRGPRRPVP